MNDSGLAVARIAGFYKISPADIWILHDDVDLALGKLKIVKGRGSAGHKGVLSVIEKLGTINFVRFRMGVGHPHSGRVKVGGKRAGKFDTDKETSDFVLSEFLPTQQDEARQLVKKTAEAVSVALEEGIEVAMNKYN
jgi:PTH1 family peptidyl-tRNA hydrolase